MINDFWYKNAIIYWLSVSPIWMQTATASETFRVSCAGLTIFKEWE